MEFVRVKKDFDVVTFINLRDDLLNDVYSILHDIVRHYDNSRNYSIELYNTFLMFHKNIRIDFELNLEDFYRFRQLNFTNNDWKVIYKIFKDTLSYCDDNPELSTFLKLFYSDVILIGPFSEDFRCLRMDYELLELMGDEIKKLYWLFDDYINNQDLELIKEIKSVCENDAVPYCVSYHLASWINDTDVEDLNALELYVVAINKVYRRPTFYQRDLDNIAEIRGSIDTSWQFSEDEIIQTFSKIESWE
jgi:hypothetical protein